MLECLVSESLSEERLKGLEAPVFGALASGLPTFGISGKIRARLIQTPLSAISPVRYESVFRKVSNRLGVDRVRAKLPSLAAFALFPMAEE